MSTAAAIAVVVGAGVSIDASRKSAKAQKEAGRISGANQRNEDAARIREQARQARIQRAKIAQAAEATGTGGGSTEVGAINSLTTQVQSNVSRVQGQQVAADAISRQNQKVADASVQSALGQGISSIGSVAFTATGGFDNLFKD